MSNLNKVQYKMFKIIVNKMLRINYLRKTKKLNE